MGSYLSGNELEDYLENPLLGQDSIAEGLIFKDTVNIFYSEPGAGKSVIALNMLASMSGGWPVFGMFPMRRFYKCMFMQLEGSKDEQLGRLKDVWRQIKIAPENIAWYSEPLLIEDLHSQQEAKKAIEEYKPEIVFIDSFYCLTTRGLSKEEGFLPVRNLLRQIKEKYGVTLIIMHHAQKPQYDGQQKVKKDDPFLGSQYMKAFADFMVHCKRESKNKTVLEVTKAHRNNEGVKSITLTFNPMNWTVQAIETENEKTANVLIAEYLRESFKTKTEITTKDIIAGTGLTNRHIRRLKNDRHFHHLCEFKEEHGHETLWVKK